MNAARSMTRYFAVCSLPMLIAFWSVSVLIQARPYDNPELRHLLADKDCAPPCFLGIRPGITSGTDALGILRTHPWIGEIQELWNSDKTEANVDWRWSRSAPAVFQLATFQEGGLLKVEDHVVRYISLVTLIQFGDVWLTWGKPDEYSWFTSHYTPGFPTYVWHSSAYYQSRFLVGTRETCPYYPGFWHRSILVYYDTTPSIDTSEKRYYDAALPARLARLDHHLCGQEK